MYSSDTVCFKTKPNNQPADTNIISINWIKWCAFTKFMEWISFMCFFLCSHSPHNSLIATMLRNIRWEFEMFKFNCTYSYEWVWFDSKGKKWRVMKFCILCALFPPLFLSLYSLALFYHENLLRMLVFVIIKLVIEFFNKISWRYCKQKWCWCNQSGNGHTRAFAN